MFKCVVQSSNVAALCVLMLMSSCFLYVALNNNVFLKLFFPPYPLLIEKSSLQSISEAHSQANSLMLDKSALCCVWQKL